MAIFVSFLLSALLVGVDQFSKYLAVTHLRAQPPIPLWPGVFELQYCENTGVAFSLLENMSWIFIPLTMVVMALLVMILVRSKLSAHALFRISCSLIIAGGLGNLIDRCWLGYVVDFFYFKLINFPIFNFADCCVVIGAALLVVFLLFIYKDEDEALSTILFGIKKKEKRTDDG